MAFEQAWLNYPEMTDQTNKPYFTLVTASDGNGVCKTALEELITAAEMMYGINPALVVGEPAGEKSQSQGIHLILEAEARQATQGYRLEERDGAVFIVSGGDAGLLYGSFALIRLAVKGSLKGLYYEEIPSNPLRMLNHWDNMDGSIERGYSGSSFFFEDGRILVNERTKEYTRLIASVGINGVVINNVNVKGDATKLITDAYTEPLAEMAALFARYGVRLFLSLNFAAPMELSACKGGLTTADPLNDEVRSWWKDTMKQVFQKIPNLGGFLVKADSEGRPGPFTYGRTHADGANMLAEAAEEYGGLIIWRCFVYNCTQDWRDRKTDRARSGYDHFMPLDGSFHDNVILQIKNGPMDFQVREPVSPLLGGLSRTNQILEVQIAQEYTGQQRHVCYLIPMFKEVLDFRTYCTSSASAVFDDHSAQSLSGMVLNGSQDKGNAGADTRDRVADLVSGRTFGQLSCGMAAVANTGSDENWTGHDLAAANLFGFGRLAFNTQLSAEMIAEEWIGATFGFDETVMKTVKSILMMSWPVYEKYTSPLGIGWMVNPGYHYGPNVDGYEYDRWGTYHRADHEGIGVERGMQGTGYASLYHEPNASMYEDPETCPEELLLFFHHVPYTYRLKSGKTVIQHIYDTHFEGAMQAQEMLHMWESLCGRLPQIPYERVHRRLMHQKEHAEEWCDQINSYFCRKSFIRDEHGRDIY